MQSWEEVIFLIILVNTPLLSNCLKYGRNFVEPVDNLNNDLVESIPSVAVDCAMKSKMSSTCGAIS